jgi:hypothetical protein
MERKLFGIVERLARQMLLEGASVEALRRVEHLRLFVRSEARAHAAATAAAHDGGAPLRVVESLRAELAMTERQAAGIDALLRQHRPALPSPRGEARATPETAAKNRARVAQDPTDALARRRDWRPEYSRAAEEIREVFQALQAGLFAGSAGLDAVRVDSSRRRFRQPVERMNERLTRLRIDRYTPWSREMERLEAHKVRAGLRIDEAGQPEKPWQGPGHAARSLLALTMDVVIDGMPLADVDALTGLRHGRTAELVAMALRRYAEIAGWLAPRAEAGPRELHPLTRAAMRRAAKGAA